MTIQTKTIYLIVLLCSKGLEAEQIQRCSFFFNSKESANLLKNAEVNSLTCPNRNRVYIGQTSRNF